MLRARCRCCLLAISRHASETEQVALLRLAVSREPWGAGAPKWRHTASGSPTHMWCLVWIQHVVVLLRVGGHMTRYVGKPSVPPAVLAWLLPSMLCRFTSNTAFCTKHYLHAFAVGGDPAGAGPPVGEARGGALHRGVPQGPGRRPAQVRKS